MNHFISLPEAIDMTTRYRQYRNVVVLPDYRNLDLLPLCETFDRSAFDALLSKPNCARIRIYYGMDVDSKIHAIIVAADEDDRDILPVTSSGGDGDDEDILERANRCPPLCPPASPLNG